jgi:hypothetical protein
MSKKRKLTRNLQKQKEKKSQFLPSKCALLVGHGSVGQKELGWQEEDEANPAKLSINTRNHYSVN